MGKREIEGHGRESLSTGGAFLRRFRGLQLTEDAAMGFVGYVYVRQSH